ncbi:MAG: hypothetical protein C4523_13710 [Myxococcales bacterium]|nr:MAG: hypothetical protein C4523_13710 [Myxococcales bacterium]
MGDGMRNWRWIGVALWVSAWVACSGEPKTELLYTDDFETVQLGPEWKNEGGHWAIRDGVLHSEGARNKDLVLTKPLPPEAVIEVDMVSHSPQVDVKFRAWGDMRGAMHDGAYHFILGGWKNTISTLAPLGEHDPRRVEKRESLQAEKWYHVKVIRHKGDIDLYLDGKPYLHYRDAEPLDPNIYKYFSFANWLTDCEFDNLKIYAIK